MFVRILSCILIGALLSGCTNGSLYSGLSGNNFCSNNDPKYAANFDGIDDYVNVNTTYTTNTYNTLEMFFKLTSGSIAQRLISFNTGNLISFQVYITVANYLAVNIPGSSCTSSVSLTSSGPLTVGTSYHIAVVRNGTNAYLFINGVQDATVGVSALSCSITQTWIGNFLQTPSYFHGVIDQVRISNIVRYSGSYTIPSQRMCDDGNTTLLLNFDDGSINLDVPAGGTFTLMGGMGTIPSTFY